MRIHEKISPSAGIEPASPSFRGHIVMLLEGMVQLKYVSERGYDTHTPTLLFTMTNQFILLIHQHFDVLNYFLQSIF